jgi:hypothetical protein
VRKDINDFIASIETEQLIGNVGWCEERVNGWKLEIGQNLVRESKTKHVVIASCSPLSLETQLS